MRTKKKGMEQTAGSKFEDKDLRVRGNKSTDYLIKARRWAAA